MDLSLFLFPFKFDFGLLLSLSFILSLYVFDYFLLLLTLLLLAHAFGELCDFIGLYYFFVSFLLLFGLAERLFAVQLLASLDIGQDFLGLSLGFLLDDDSLEVPFLDLIDNNLASFYEIYFTLNLFLLFRLDRLQPLYLHHQIFSFLLDFELFMGLFLSC